MPNSFSWLLTLIWWCLVDWMFEVSRNNLFIHSNMSVSSVRKNTAATAWHLFLVLVTHRCEMASHSSASICCKSAHLCLHDFGVCVQELFNLSRVNVLSTSDDHVFNPALDSAVAVRINAANVSAGNRKNY